MKRDYLFLRIANLYGGLFCLLFIGAYLFTGFSSGEMKFIEIQLILLPLGIILGTVFVYSLTSYNEKDTQTRCPRLAGIWICLMCFFSSFLLIMTMYFFILTATNSPTTILSIIPVIIGVGFVLILDMRLMRLLRRCDRISPRKLFPRRIRGLQISTVVICGGLLFTSFNIPQYFESVGYASISYGVYIHASGNATFILPIPVEKSSGNIFNFTNNTVTFGGNSTWKIVDTSYGVALEIQTNGDCRFNAEKDYGLQKESKSLKLFNSHTFSLLNTTLYNGYQGYHLYIYSSQPNSTVTLDFSLNGFHHGTLENTYRRGSVTLKKGWQTIEIWGYGIYIIQ